MPAIGFGVAWGGYTLMLWGYCLLRGYDVKLTQLINPAHPVTWKQATASKIPDDQILPGGGTASPGAGGSGNQGLPPNSGWKRPSSSGACPPRSTKVKLPDGSIACIPYATSPQAM